MDAPRNVFSVEERRRWLDKMRAYDEAVYQIVLRGTKIYEPGK